MLTVELLQLVSINTPTGLIHLLLADKGIPSCQPPNTVPVASRPTLCQLPAAQHCVGADGTEVIGGCSSLCAAAALCC
ncbi:MAG TPA: hypothetical protein V6C90_16310 [Coleofasciculaceae cyanobacterium]